MLKLLVGNDIPHSKLPRAGCAHRWARRDATTYYNFAPQNYHATARILSSSVARKTQPASVLLTHQALSAQHRAQSARLVRLHEQTTVFLDRVGRLEIASAMRIVRSTGAGYFVSAHRKTDHGDPECNVPGDARLLAAPFRAQPVQPQREPQHWSDYQNGGDSSGHLALPVGNHKPDHSANQDEQDDRSGCAVGKIAQDCQKHNIRPTLPGQVDSSTDCRFLLPRFGRLHSTPIATPYKTTSAIAALTSIITRSILHPQQL